MRTGDTKSRPYVFPNAITTGNTFQVLILTANVDTATAPRHSMIRCERRTFRNPCCTQSMSKSCPDNRVCRVRGNIVQASKNVDQ